MVPRRVGEWTRGGARCAARSPRRPGDRSRRPYAHDRRGHDGGRPSSISPGIGFDARVAKQLQRARRRQARVPGPISCSACVKAAATGPPNIGWSSTASAAVRALLIAFANGREYGLGARIAPGAELDDGLLDATSWKNDPCWRGSGTRAGWSRARPTSRRACAPRASRSASIEADGADGVPRRRRTGRGGRSHRGADSSGGAEDSGRHGARRSIEMNTDEFFEAAQTGQRRVAATARRSRPGPDCAAGRRRRDTADDGAVPASSRQRPSGSSRRVRRSTSSRPPRWAHRHARAPAPAVGAGLNAYSYDGWTPLHLAAFFGQRAAVERLMAAGADLNAVSRNALRNTPAACRGRRRARRSVAAAHRTRPPT